MSEQSPEIFDDLYLGLQAGGAMRKQRRGEELTEQEAAALGRWQRLSMWRKGVAIGAFATSQIVVVKEIGVGVALAVLIDATIVRALLVPSLMAILGRWNWWPSSRRADGR